MNIFFDPLARMEYQDAFDYYEVQEEGLGERFRRAVWAAIEILEQYPQIGEEVRPGIRKILLRRFPYKLIYAATDKGLLVIAVAHGRRKPDYWHERE
ncbi:MAG: type II toxin-antitoxin system RelE/ParE family toxin [Desulfatibacillaceae bacterium]|nr:type II toxin-antitoxin system RelE/ParE family toxin [Desulfatibacillaceae bacterium]